MDLFSPIKIGPYDLPNRMAMAPLARARCDQDRVPTEMVGAYYAQRASAGLLVSEASAVSPMSVSRPGAAAMFTDAQAQGWARVARAVHEAGGRIFQQLYHLGRKSDPSRMPGGATPVAPSAIAAKGQVNGTDGPVDFAQPRALETAEIPAVIEEFRAAARRSLEAGLDGIEIHGANSFLIDQFLKDGTNRRGDGYGGKVENRARFLIEVLAAVAEVFGAARVGLRLSPHSRGDGIGDGDLARLYGHLAGALDGLGLAYIHLVEAQTPDAPQAPAAGEGHLLGAIRGAYKGPLIVNGAFTRESAAEMIASGGADMVAFGALYIANPDLVERFRRDAPLNPPDLATLHNGGAEGYTDYPFLEA